MHRRMRSPRCSAAPSIRVTSAPNLLPRSPAMTLIGWIGVWLLAVSAVAFVVEGLLAAVWGMAMAKRSRALAELIQTERGLVEADIARLRARTLGHGHTPH